MLHADVLGHFQTGDFFIASGRQGDVTIIHTEDLALAFFYPRSSQCIVAPRCLIPSESDPSRMCSVIDAGILGKRSPAATNVK